MYTSSSSSCHGTSTDIPDPLSPLLPIVHPYAISVVGVGNCFCGVPSASFLCQLEAVFFDFINWCSKHIVLTDDKKDMGLVCLLSVLLLQCWSSLCLHPENIVSLWCFYRESLLLRWSLLVCCMQVEFVPSSLCEWNQRPW